MSPAGTRARVYQAIKTRVMAGGFAPGERIDPARLAPELAASVTPIRDALHRLAGERMVESWSQEGFRQPLLGETMLRHLYAWSGDLARLVLRAGERDLVRPTWFAGQGGADYADATAALFDGLGRLSTNLEHRTALASLNDRLHLVRTVEPESVPDASNDLVLVGLTVAAAEWSEARRAVAHYHGARLRRVPEIAAALLARSAR